MKLDMVLRIGLKTEEKQSKREPFQEMQREKERERESGGGFRMMKGELNQGAF